MPLFDVSPDFDLLPMRVGPRPATTATAPHRQLNQLGERGAIARVLQRAATLPDVVISASVLEEDSRAMHLDPTAARGPQEAFFADTEFAIAHTETDGSVHMVLPERIQAQAVRRGWAEAHPFAGRATVPPLAVMVYAPRNDAEADVVAALIEAAWTFARGTVGGAG